jgi:adenine-specific DNA-methyltransferase
LIKYIGSKRVLVPLITRVVDAVGGVRSVVDLFSGTSRVGHALKRSGKQVFANDHNAYAATLARCYVQADAEDVLDEVRERLELLRTLPGEPGYVTDVFCEQSRYFQPKNGARIDAVRDRIACWDLSPEVEAVLLVSLMEAADRVDSTTGVQMAYLKKWARRSFNDLELRVPDVLSRAAAGKGGATQLDAVDAAKQLSADLVYIDPPYNQHKYVGNYHIWETLVLWDKPEHYGIAKKRVDCKARRSVFNSRPRILPALEQIVDAVDARHLLVSFSNEGYVPRDSMIELLSRRGHVQVIERDFDRYVGARIGIHSPKGERVGTVSHVKNKEYLFLVTPADAPMPDLSDLAS